MIRGHIKSHPNFHHVDGHDPTISVWLEDGTLLLPGEH